MWEREYQKLYVDVENGGWKRIPRYGDL